MNTLLDMNPWAFLDDLLDTQSRTFRNIRARAAGRFPPVNIYLDDNAALIDIELPGKTAGDVELTLEHQALVIAAKKDKPEEGDEIKSIWSRRVELPFTVNPDKANAKFANGILRIELPRAEAAVTHKIVIK